jgi:hypothetical protein
MAKNVAGLERGDILVASGKAYIYADPNDAALDLEVDVASDGTKFGVATGNTKIGKDKYSYTEMVFYIESTKTYDLSGTKYYILQSTYKIEENPDYDYTSNNKKSIFGTGTGGTGTGGDGNGFNKFIDLISGIFGIAQANKNKEDQNSTEDTNNEDERERTSNNGDDNESWFQKNRFTVIIGSLVLLIIGITVFIAGKNKKKKAMTVSQTTLPTAAV